MHTKDNSAVLCVRLLYLVVVPVPVPLLVHGSMFFRVLYGKLDSIIPLLTLHDKTCTLQGVLGCFSMAARQR